MVNYRQCLNFDHPYLLCNCNCDWWLFQEIFLLFSEATVRRCSLGVVRKCRNICRKASVLESLFNNIAGLMGLQIYLNLVPKRILTRVFSWEYWKTFMNSFFYITPLVAALVSSMMGICQYSLLNQNKKCGTVSLKKVCRSGQSMLCMIWHVHIISRNHSRFYWLTCREQKLVQAKTLQERLFVLILAFWQCRQVFVYYYLMSILVKCK